MPASSLASKQPYRHSSYLFECVPKIWELPRGTKGDLHDSAWCGDACPLILLTLLKRWEERGKCRPGTSSPTWRCGVSSDTPGIGPQDHDPTSDIQYTGSISEETRLRRQALVKLVTNLTGTPPHHATSPQLHILQHIKSCNLLRSHSTSAWPATVGNPWSQRLSRLSGRLASGSKRILLT